MASSGLFLRLLSWLPFSQSNRFFSVYPFCSKRILVPPCTFAHFYFRERSFFSRFSRLHQFSRNFTFHMGANQRGSVNPARFPYAWFRLSSHNSVPFCPATRLRQAVVKGLKKCSPSLNFLQGLSPPFAGRVPPYIHVEFLIDFS